MKVYSEPRGTNGVREETSTSNENIFKVLHRSFHRSCYAQDIDLLEYRYNEWGEVYYACVWELKQAVHVHNNSDYDVIQRIEEYYLKPQQVKITLDIAERLQCNALLLIYTLNNSMFYIHQIGDDTSEFTAYTLDELKNFIRTL